MKKLHKKNKHNNWFEIACALTALISMAVLIHFAHPSNITAATKEGDEELASSETTRRELRRTRVRRDFDRDADNDAVIAETTIYADPIESEDDEDDVVIPGEEAYSTEEIDDFISYENEE